MLPPLGTFAGQKRDDMEETTTTNGAGGHGFAPYADLMMWVRTLAALEEDPNGLLDALGASIDLARVRYGRGDCLDRAGCYVSAGLLLACRGGGVLDHTGDPRVDLALAAAWEIMNAAMEEDHAAQQEGDDPGDWDDAKAAELLATVAPALGRLTCFGEVETIMQRRRERAAVAS
jgi:hypothetical protein